MRWEVQSCILRARFLLLSCPQILKCKNQKVWTLTQVQTLQNHKHIIYYSYLGLKSEYLDNWCLNFIRRILDALLSFIFNEKYYASREWGLYKAITILTYLNKKANNSPNSSSHFTMVMNLSLLHTTFSVTTSCLSSIRQSDKKVCMKDKGNREEVKR